MSELVIIITMAGQGSRFRKAGYNIPKYMIESKGRTLFEWSISSLEGYLEHVKKFIFVVQKQDAAKEFIIDKCKKMELDDILIVELDSITDGQATTCMKAIPYCNSDDSILIYNIDTFVEPFALKYDQISGDGHIPCFHSPGEHWSFIRLGKNGEVKEVREKSRISDNCSIGAYYFKSASLFSHLYDACYSSYDCQCTEKYVAPLYNVLISEGKEVSVCMIDSKFVHALGTPEELHIFESVSINQ